MVQAIDWPPKIIFCDIRMCIQMITLIQSNHYNIGCFYIIGALCLNVVRFISYIAEFLIFHRLFHHEKKGPGGIGCCDGRPLFVLQVCSNAVKCWSSPWRLHFSRLPVGKILLSARWKCYQSWLAHEIFTNFDANKSVSAGYTWRRGLFGGSRRFCVSL